MAEELGWSATDRGLVSSAFFWGYALTQIPAGFVSTKYVREALHSLLSTGICVCLCTQNPGSA